MIKALSQGREPDSYPEHRTRASQTRPPGQPTRQFMFTEVAIRTRNIETGAAFSQRRAVLLEVLHGTSIRRLAAYTQGSSVTGNVPLPTRNIERKHPHLPAVFHREQLSYRDPWHLRGIHRPLRFSSMFLEGSSIVRVGIRDAPCPVSRCSAEESPILRVAPNKEARHTVQARQPLTNLDR